MRNRGTRRLRGESNRVPRRLNRLKPSLNGQHKVSILAVIGILQKEVATYRKNVPIRSMKSNLLR